MARDTRTTTQDCSYRDWLSGAVQLIKMTPEQRAERVSRIPAPEPGCLWEALSIEAHEKKATMPYTRGDRFIASYNWLAMRLTSYNQSIGPSDNFDSLLNEVYQRRIQRETRQAEEAKQLERDKYFKRI